MQTEQFDAIVIGSGISGGWAAKELTEGGLKTLMIDRGHTVRHGADYTAEGRPAFDLPYRNHWPRGLQERDYPVTGRYIDPAIRDYFANERLNPYVRDDDRPFNWVRADMVGGRSVVWGRQCYRWSDLDFEANKADGHGNDWPIRYRDIARWYSHVEKFVGIAGERLGLPQLPDGEFLPPMPFNVAEEHFRNAIAEAFDGRAVTIGRTAHLTESRPEQGRTNCQYRAQCHRGCSFGSSFSTQSTTLPAANATGRLTVLPDTVVASLEFDSATRRVSGVRVIDIETRKATTHRSRLVFLCASCIASNQLLLNSRSAAAPNGLGNANGLLGRYLMDHTARAGASGILPGYEHLVEYGRRPTGMYVPRFRNLDGQDEDADFLRGYNFQSWGPGRSEPADFSGFGKDLKAKLRVPGPWQLPLYHFGEMLPRHRNRVFLDEHKLDRFGIPQVRFDIEWSDNERRIAADAARQAEAMLKAAGCRDLEVRTDLPVPGSAVHEMGGARMGEDPDESVINGWNQLHDAPNLFVTDGAAMASASCVNPSLTYMALTARAADYAVAQVRASAL